MSYTIKFTNGKTLAVVADQSIDDVSTSITLVGKNVNNYGQYVNANFVSLLENFSNLIEPSSPVVGQTWFDTSEGRLKVYSTGTFKPVGAPIISTIEPAGAVRGDLWVDTTDNLLKWYDGTVWQLAAKQYSDSVGKEGWFVDTITDSSGFDHELSIFYSQGVRWAVMSTSTITLQPETLTAIALGTSTIRSGLMINSAIGAKFYGVATSAESIQGVSLDSVLRSNSSTDITGKFDFVIDSGISIGANTNIELLVDNTGVKTSVIRGTIAREPLEIRYNSDTYGDKDAIHIDSLNDRIGIFNNAPTTDIDITGDVRISGNLIVEGSQVNLEVSTIRVDDRQIELAVQTTATDDGADQGGIVVQGATNKLWQYNNDDLVKGWESNININLATTASSYKIAGMNIIEYDSPGYFKLSGTVRSAPGLQNLPVMNVLTVTNAVISEITTPISPLSSLVLNPSNGIVDLNSTAKIGGMAPTTDLDTDDTAVSKGYFEGRLAGALGGYSSRKPYTLNLDVTDFDTIDADVIEYLNLVLPIDGAISGVPDPYYAQPDGSRCSVICTKYYATTATYLLSNLNTSTVRKLFNIVTGIDYTATSTTTSFINTITSTSTLLVTDFELAGNVTIATPMPRIERFIRYYAVIGGFWTFITDSDTIYLSSLSASTLSTGTKTFVVNKDSTELYGSTGTYGLLFNTGTSIVIRETDTQINSLEGTVALYSGTNLTVNVTAAYNTATTSTFTSWIIRRDL
jgi:hypothetical protein